MSEPEDDVMARLAGLGRSTRALRPSAGFQQRVMLAAAAERRRNGSRALLRTARPFLPLAALVAALGLIWASMTERSANAAVAVSDPPMTTELYW